MERRVWHVEKNAPQESEPGIIKRRNFLQFPSRCRRGVIGSSSSFPRQRRAKPLNVQRTRREEVALIGLILKAN